MKMNANNDYDTAPGFVRLRVGDILLIERHEHIVDLVNESRARCINTASKQVISIATSVERGTVLERRGEAGLKEFLASRTKRGAATETSTKEGTVMGKKSKKAKLNKRPARGGLAAQIRDKNAAEAATKPRKTRKPKETNGAPRETVKSFVDGLCTAGNTTKAEAVKLVMEKFGTEEKAAKGAISNARHFQKKAGRPVGEWKQAPKPEPATA